MSESLTEFVERHVLKEYQPIFWEFCEQVAAVAPEASMRMRGVGTEKYYSVPVFRVKRDIIAISPTKRGITFSFTKGARFRDPYGILTGTGKNSRTVFLKRIDEYPREALTDLIRQAVNHDLSS
jgi:hypothetical protein